MIMTKKEKIEFLKKKLEALEERCKKTSDVTWEQLGLLASAILVLMED